MKTHYTSSWLTRAAGVLATAAALVALPSVAQAYNPAGGTLYSPSSQEVDARNKPGNVLYPKTAQLENGRLVMAFEKSFGDPTRQTMPLYKSDDYGASWQPLLDLPAPAQLTKGTAREDEFAKYTSNWTNPYFYRLQRDVGDLKAGTMLLATLVSGQDELYAEQKAADPNWKPEKDGDRRDLAIALYKANDQNGTSWEFLNIITAGGWSGSSLSAANSLQQVDPVWEPYLMEYNGNIVAYYTTEVDYTGFDPYTGILQRLPEWQTQPEVRDQAGPLQILAHTQWDGRSGSNWTAPVADETGETRQNPAGGTLLGGNRPGMTNVVPTTDGKWILTTEFGVTKISDNPLRFFDKPRVDLRGKGLDPCGAPVHVVIPDQTDATKWRLAFNSGCTGEDIYVNDTGRSDGTWVKHRSPLPGSYSRNITVIPQTGRIVQLWANFGLTSDVRFAEVDLGDSEGAYYRLTNVKTGQVLGTGNNAQDSDYAGNRFLTNEVAGSVANADTQWWHLVPKGNNTTLLNKAGGRAMGIWGGSGNARVGTPLAQWVDDGGSDKNYVITKNPDGTVKIRATAGQNLFVTGGLAGSTVELQNATTDGSQDWRLQQLAPTPTDLSSSRALPTLVADTATVGSPLALNASRFTPAGVPRNAGLTGTVYLLSGTNVTNIGTASFGPDQTTTVTVPATAPEGDVRVAVAFDSTPLVWDTVRINAAPNQPSLRVEASASSRCIGRQASVVVQARNTDTVPISVTLKALDGSRTFATVRPGKSASYVSTSRSTTLPTGTAEVTVFTKKDGTTVSSTQRVKYEALTTPCK